MHSTPLPSIWALGGTQNGNVKSCRFVFNLTETLELPLDFLLGNSSSQMDATLVLYALTKFLTVLGQVDQFTV